jgi:hypothetical protein
MAGDVADAVDIGDGRTAEFHDKTAHARDFSSVSGWKRRLYIPALSGPSNRAKG